MIKKLKKAKNTNAFDESDHIVNGFVLRAPFWSYRAAEYRRYDSFYEYQIKLDKYMDNLFDAKAIDDGNGNVMNNLIDNIADKAYADLEKQKIDHEDVIEYFNIRFRADKLHFSKELKLLQKELEKNERQIAEINQRYYKNKFIKLGDKINEK